MTLETLSDEPDLVAHEVAARLYTEVHHLSRLIDDLEHVMDDLSVYDWPRPWTTHRMLIDHADRLRAMIERRNLRIVE